MRDVYNFCYSFLQEGNIMAFLQKFLFFIGNILSQSENRNLTKGFFDLVLNDLRIHCSILSNSSLSYL